MTKNKKTGEELRPYVLNPKKNQAHVWGNDEPLDGVNGMDLSFRPSQKNQK